MVEGSRSRRRSHRQKLVVCPRDTKAQLGHRAVAHVLAVAPLSPNHGSSGNPVDPPTINHPKAKAASELTLLTRAVALDSNYCGSIPNGWLRYPKPLG
jgi:hypothetical protein